MNCADLEQDNTAGRYLAGKLSEAEREAFERHYFECDACFEYLQELRQARAAVRDAGPPLVVVTRTRRRWIAPGLGIAAAILLAGFLFFRAKPDPTTATEAPAVNTPQAKKEPAMELARLDPPPYVLTTLRGAESSAGAEFRDAMRHYSDHDYAAAATALAVVIEHHPGSLDARYFMSVSRLLSGDAAGGIDGLRTVIAAGSRSPYVEEAHYYLAHALLRTGDKVAAKSELRNVAGMRGDYEQKARDALKLIH